MAKMTPKYIILHHSLTKDSGTVSWTAIREYHLKKKWINVGYHWGLELINDHYEVLMGRMPNQVGAHCRQDQMNYRSIGICMVGNFDIAKPPKEQWGLCLRLVNYLCGALGIPKDNVYGHNMMAHYKTCPGAFFDVDAFVEELKAL